MFVPASLADDGGPIFGQIADQLSDQIADGGLDEGGRQQLIGTRRRQFAERYVQPLVTEGARLGLGVEDLVALVREQSAAAGLTTAGSPA